MWGSPRIATGAPQFAHVRAGGDRLACVGPPARNGGQKQKKPAAAGAGRAEARAGDATG